MMESRERYRRLIGDMERIILDHVANPDERGIPRDKVGSLQFFDLAGHLGFSYGYEPEDIFHGIVTLEKSGYIITAEPKPPPRRDLSTKQRMEHQRLNGYPIGLTAPGLAYLNYGAS